MVRLAVVFRPVDFRAVDFRAVDFRVVDFRAVDLRAVAVRPVDFRAVDFRVPDLRVELRLAVVFRPPVWVPRFFLVAAAFFAEALRFRLAAVFDFPRAEPLLTVAQARRAASSSDRPFSS